MPVFSYNGQMHVPSTGQGSRCATRNNNPVSSNVSQACVDLSEGSNARRNICYISKRAGYAGEIWVNGGPCLYNINTLLHILFVNDYKCLASVILVPCDIVNIKAKQKPSLPFKKDR
jgi:hypothetical protein